MLKVLWESYYIFRYLRKDNYFSINNRDSALVKIHNYEFTIKGVQRMSRDHELG